MIQMLVQHILDQILEREADWLHLAWGLASLESGAHVWSNLIITISNAPSRLPPSGLIRRMGEGRKNGHYLVHIPGREDWELVYTQLGWQGSGKPSQWKADSRERVSWREGPVGIRLSLAFEEIRDKVWLGQKGKTKILFEIEFEVSGELA